MIASVEKALSVIELVRRSGRADRRGARNAPRVGPG